MTDDYLLLCPHERCAYVALSKQEDRVFRAIQYHLWHSHTTEEHVRQGQSLTMEDIKRYFTSNVQRVESMSKTRRRARDSTEDEDEDELLRPRRRQCLDRFEKMVMDLYECDLKSTPHHFFRLCDEIGLEGMSYPVPKKLDVQANIFWSEDMTKIYTTFHNYHQLLKVETHVAQSIASVKAFAAQTIPLLPTSSHEYLQDRGHEAIVPILCNILNILPDRHPMHDYVHRDYLVQRHRLQCLIQTFPNPKDFLYFFTKTRGSPQALTRCPGCGYHLDEEGTSCLLCTFYPMHTLVV